ncbi:MAG TPA: 50S ribosomal protein L11 methyltransferase, partial [Fimbriimonadaceae bacterium]|nr:50S ribosomal protein L11 methyltransferase [Fimbriimonadaceae bacterium]
DPPTLSAYVPPKENVSVADLTAQLQEMGADVTTEQVEEIDWAEAWRDFFKPQSIGERVWIRPSWEDAVCPEGRIEIVLDPGQAFGTGDHPTTRMCLHLLERADLDGKSVADIGCGSGILSVAAKKFGSASVDAVDVDSISVESARANAALNEVDFAAYEGAGFEPLADKVYDVVLSNIISAAIIALAREVPAHLAPGGTWIVSGIIGPNWPDVRDEVSAHGFEVVERMEEGDWVAASLRR